MVYHLSVLPATSVSNTQCVRIDNLGSSSPWTHWLLGLLNTHLSNEHRSRSAIHRTRGSPGFHLTLNRTRPETCCLIAALPEAKFTTQWLLFRYVTVDWNQEVG